MRQLAMIFAFGAGFAAGALLGDVWGLFLGVAGSWISVVLLDIADRPIGGK
ncbi:MAG TPA: hypothetical protein VKT73_13010 [Xanthobacteraceae bacterium]|nr:hypothetical protein [Xanthobacteraceae bacterium]